jgi:hypothetical protein
MKKILSIIFLLILSKGYTQTSYKIQSKDGKVIVQNFISYEEGRDSVIVKHRKCKLKFSYHTPLFNFVNNDGYNPVDPSFVARSVRKITKNIYMLIGIGGNTNFETELNLIFIKKGEILKYYIVKSNNKLLRDVTFEYLPKTKEVLIPIPKKQTPLNYIYDINIKENKLDSIRALEESKLAKFHRYKLKIK